MRPHENIFNGTRGLLWSHQASIWLHALVAATMLLGVSCVAACSSEPEPQYPRVQPWPMHPMQGCGFDGQASSISMSTEMAMDMDMDIDTEDLEESDWKLGPTYFGVYVHARSSSAPVAGWPDGAPPVGSHAQPTWNAYASIFCQSEKGDALADWSGFVHWSAPEPWPFVYTANITKSGVIWTGDGQVDIDTFRIKVRANGSGGISVRQWMPAKCRVLSIHLVPYRILPDGHKEHLAKLTQATEHDSGASQGAGAGPGLGGNGKQGAAGRRSSSGQEGGQQGGHRRGKPGGVPAEQGGVDGEFSRQFGEKFGASQGAIGGEGDRDDHGARGMSLAGFGLLDVPATIRPVVEVAVLLEDVQPGKIAAGWVRKAMGKKAVDVLRRELGQEASAFARKRLQECMPGLRPWLDTLSPQDRFHTEDWLKWHIQRRYFERVEKGALERIRALELELTHAPLGMGRTQLEAELEGATKLLQVTKVKPVAGRLPANHQYAGQWYPAERLDRRFRKRGLYFTEDGFPDFAPHAKKLPNGQTSVKIEFSGDYELDKLRAGKAAGFPPDQVSVVPPDGYRWHHHQDGETMMLVPKKLHDKVKHTGGTAVYRHTVRERNAYRGPMDTCNLGHRLH